jgi:hypothetical protein
VPSEIRQTIIYSFWENLLAWRQNKLRRETVVVFDYTRLPVNLKRKWLQISAGAHEKHGDITSAYECYTKMNLLAVMHYVKADSHRMKYLSGFKFFRECKVTRTVELSHKTYTNLVFIIGLPRSGTTLLQTILEVNPAVHVMEEKPYLANAIENSVKNGQINAERVLNSYTAVLKHMNSSQIVIDKLPLNVKYAPVISQIFPGSHIIYCHRQPMDAIFSAFAQDFLLNPAMLSFTTLDSSQRLYDEVYLSFLEAYERSKDTIHIYHYENLIENFEIEINGILQFLNLPLTSGYKHFDKKNRERKQIINTPSHSQVVRPLYSKSIGRSQPFEQHFENVDSLQKKNEKIISLRNG